MSTEEKPPAGIIKQEFHLTVETDSDAVTLLATATGLTKTRVKQVMKQGAVWWQRGEQVRRLRRASRKVAAHDELHLYYDAAVLATTTDDAILVADEGSYSVWNKPAGMLSQGSKWGDHCTLTRFAEQHLTPQRSAYLVHRLDRAANGLIVIAHSKTSARELSRQFHDREVVKIYRAQVRGHLVTDTEVMRLTTPVDNKPARSDVTTHTYDEEADRTWVTVQIHTGRKHQIRRHLAEAGWPIIGDRLYGNHTEKLLPHTEATKELLQLTAWQLTLRDPITNETKYYQLPWDKLGKGSGDNPER